MTVRHTPSVLQPFSRDQLLLSIHSCCQHRPKAAQEASALTQTIIAALQSNTHNGAIERAAIIRTAYETLSHFDQTAASLYRAYHPLSA